MCENLSGLAYIEVKNSCNPFELFQEWQNEANKFNASTMFMNIATASKTGIVSNRTIVVKDISEDGVTFVTTDKGKKARDLRENPSVSACFLWSYCNDNKDVKRQIRIEGVAKPLPREELIKQFNSQPLFAKIRGVICRQGSVVDWEELKRTHDSLLKDVTEKGTQIEVPDDFTGYKIIPSAMDFYYAYDNFIGDRLLFTKEGETWKYNRICC